MGMGPGQMPMMMLISLPQIGRPGNPAEYGWFRAIPQRLPLQPEDGAVLSDSPIGDMLAQWLGLCRRGRRSYSCCR